MKRIWNLVGMSILVALMTGCSELTKFIHQKENNGYEMKGDMGIVKDATMKVLQDQGYSSSVTQTYWGPDGNGFQVMAKRTQSSSLESLGVQAGLGAIMGVKNQKFDAGTEYDLVISENRKWDDTYKNAVPEVTIFNISGTKAKVDQHGNQDTPETINNVDLDNIKAAIEKQVQDIYQQKGLKY